MTEAEGYDVIADIQDNGSSVNLLPYNVNLESGQIYVGIINETSGDFEPLAVPRARLLSPAGNLLLEVALEAVPEDNEFADMVNHWYNGSIDLSANTETGQASLVILDNATQIGVMDVWLTPGTDTFVMRVSDTDELTQVNIESSVIDDALGFWSVGDEALPEIENLLFGYQELSIFPDSPEIIEVRNIDTENRQVLVDIGGENILLAEDKAIMKVLGGQEVLVGMGGIETREYAYKGEIVSVNYAMLTLAPANLSSWEELVGSPAIGSLSYEEKRFRPMDHTELLNAPQRGTYFTYVTASGDQVWKVQAQPGQTFGPFDVGMRSHYLTTATGGDWMETTNFNSPQLRWRTKDKNVMSYLHVGPFEFMGEESKLGDFAYEEKMIGGSFWGGPIGVLTEGLHNGYWQGGGWQAQGGDVRIRGM
jgi:hypothetical protein